MKPGRKVSHDWEAIKAAFLASQHSTREIALIFSVNPETVACYAKRHGWVKQRKQMLAPFQEHIDAQIRKTVAAQSVPTNGQNTQKSGPNAEISKDQSSGIIPAEERIKGIRPKVDNFRQRISEQTDRVLDHLETREINTIHDADQFVSVLEKTEKVGSRARGLDRDDEKSSRVLINLGILNSDGSLGSASVMVHDSGTLPS